jgi:hypothetical protein
MLSQLSAARQASINSICSSLVFFNIHSTHDLTVNFVKITKQISQDPNIFKSSDSLLYRTAIFEAAVSAYAKITEFNIKVSPDVNLNLLSEHSVEASASSSSSSSSSSNGKDVKKDSAPRNKAIATDDLSKVTRSYDELGQALHSTKSTSKALKKILKEKAYGVCDTIILGAGDTGTTLWLEKYKALHGETYKSIAANKLPDVLMLSDGFGGWQYDYTLAQTQSSLERSNADKNPSDFMSTEFYQKNPQANARHIFQANQVCLGRTQAPMLKTNVKKIEKRENHSDNWESSAHPYRLIVASSNGVKKAIYTNNVEVCTGLGAANYALDSTVIQPAELKRLGELNPRLGFTPVVDGNQFALTDAEVQNNNRAIVIYGGGGTATACYRKSFFGTDVRTYDRPYISDNQKNRVFWVYKDFIGTGKMAENALRAAKASNEVLEAELTKITEMGNGQLSLEFKILKPEATGPATKTIVCDQLVYSIGQNDVRARAVCTEVGSGLQVQTDKAGMLLYVSSPDDGVRFFGAAAVAFAKNEFNGQTMEWLASQNIRGDVGAGSMPPTRAQVKRHLAMKGVKPESINANMDTTTLIKDYLLDVGVQATVADDFIKDLLEARKHDTYGCTREMIEGMLNKHKLNTILDIYGHSHLVLKGQKTLDNSSAMPTLTVFGGLGNKQTVSVDDMRLPVKAVQQHGKKKLVRPTDDASVASSASSAATTVVSTPSSVPQLTSQSSRDGMFGKTRRKEEADSFAFISTATNTDASEDSEKDKEKIVVAPTIKTSGN